MSDIGKKMYERRKQLGLTLEEVGNAVGVGRSTVQRWEKGMIKNMGRDKIVALAKILQMDPVEFVPGYNGDGSLKRLEVKGEKPPRLFAVDASPRMNGKIRNDLNLPEFKAAGPDKELEALMKVWRVSSPERKKKIVRIIKTMFDD